MFTDFYYPSCGEGMIHGCRWEPEGQIKAVVQIVHGVAEHTARYDHFASWLANRGILVVAEDHMGHGGSIGDDGVKGYFSGGWHKSVADTHRLLSYTRMECPDVPYILLGHSMGSMIARTMLIKYPKSGISAVILSGTLWMHRGIVNTGFATASLMGRGGKDKAPSKLLTDMMFGGYNRKIEHQRTAFDWLSRDQHIVDAYIEDPLCGFPVTAGLVKDMMTGLLYIQEPAHLEKMKKALPVLFIAGANDPVGAYGEGVKQTAQAFVKAGMENVSMRLYPLCRHEILNELNREEVYQNILDWLSKQGVLA